MRDLIKLSVVPMNFLLPLVMFFSLFAILGFTNTFSDPMLRVYNKVLELSNSEASWVQTLFYGGYFCISLPLVLLSRKYSYKMAVLIGLVSFS